LQRLYRRLQGEGDHHGDGDGPYNALAEPRPSSIATLNRLTQAIGGSHLEQVEPAEGTPHDSHAPTDPIGPETNVARELSEALQRTGSWERFGELVGPWSGPALTAVDLLAQALYDVRISCHVTT
jgi:hypothetical protein